MPHRKPPARRSTDDDTGRYRRQWRDYRTRSGRRVVREEIMALPTPERAAVTAAMADVAKNGKRAARHLRGEIWEVRAEGADVIYRLLFATEGRYSQVLLGLVFFVKKTQRTPPAQIQLAEQRLADWRSRGSST
jgi:phage-related protein